MRSKTSLFAGLTPPMKKPLPLIPQQIANNRDIRSVSARLKIKSLGLLQNTPMRKTTSTIPKGLG